MLGAVSAGGFGVMKVLVREAPINPHHWYVAALASQLTDKPLGITLWQQPVVLFRDSNQVVHALEDSCPHRFVKLSRGRVVNGELECAYHGWCIDRRGKCSKIPYLEPGQKLPTRGLKTYPVLERDGFIWIFLGNPDLAEATKGFAVPEWYHLNYISSVTEFTVNCHFSFLIENLMDMYHGHLHDTYQAWAQPQLKSIETNEQEIIANYDAQSYYRVDRIWSVSQLFLPWLRQLHPAPLQVRYAYPHWRASLGEDFRIYCLFAPIDRSHTRAFLLHFTSLERFPNLHKLPSWFRLWIKKTFHNSAKSLLNNLVKQDILMLKDEQNSYDREGRKPLEINRTLIAVQKLIENQASRG